MKIHLCRLEFGVNCLADIGILYHAWDRLWTLEGGVPPHSILPYITIEDLTNVVSKGAIIQKILLFTGCSKHFLVQIINKISNGSRFQVLQGRCRPMKVGIGTGATVATYSLSNPAAVR
jgi:hypothetical protein